MKSPRPDKYIEGVKRAKTGDRVTDDGIVIPCPQEKKGSSWSKPVKDRIEFAYSQGIAEGRKQVLEEVRKIIDGFRNTADYGKGWEEVKRFRSYLKAELSKFDNHSSQITQPADDLRNNAGQGCRRMNGSNPSSANSLRGKVGMK